MINIHKIITLLFIVLFNSVFAQQGLEKESMDISKLFSGTAINKAEKANTSANEHYHKTSTCNFQEVNRKIDGTCNNISTGGFNLGSSGEPLQRIIPDVYNSNSDLVGANRKNPREISELVCIMTDEVPSPTLSSFVFTWGQFLDHDIIATAAGNQAAPIADIANDKITGPIPFERSLPLSGTGKNGIAREQFNQNTSWIDASNVYGSDIGLANDLRTFSDGKLKVSSAKNGEDILPKINNNFTAGDERALEQPGLTSLHILFVREHNRICQQLKNCGMTDDETIYQKARKQVGALIQSISFHEFLPALGIQLPAYKGYDQHIEAAISNVFATAAYRLGHTMVTDKVTQFDDYGNQLNSLSLAEAFFNPILILNDGIEGFLNGLAQQFQEEVDSRIVESLRSFLFAPTPGSAGFDLAALNIQRGRDHGLADYNTFRTAFGIKPANDFSDISSNTILQKQLATAYDNNINNIDVWVGLLSEDHLSGASVGPTLHAILSQQFTALRDGDFYYFENDPTLTDIEKTIIRNTRLSDVIKRNTHIKNIKADVFYGPCKQTNQYQATTCIPDRGDCHCEVWEVCEKGSCISNSDPNACQCKVALQFYNDGNCPVDLFHWLPTGDIFIAGILPETTFSIYTNEGERWRIYNKLANVNESYTVVGCHNQIVNATCIKEACVADATFTEPIAGFLDKEVSGWITGKTNNVIQKGANVTYDAGKSVRLQPGFKAVHGSRFHAFIDGCWGDAKIANEDNHDLELLENEVALSIYPNPANQFATIHYQLPGDSQVSINLFDATGRQLHVLTKNQLQAAGKHQLTLDASDLATGIYYLKLQTDENYFVKKLMIAK